MGLFNFNKKKEAPKTMLDRLQDFAFPAIVNGYRRIAVEKNTAPTSKTSDQKIIEIYQLVGTAFREASQKRNEHIPAGQINNIVLNFIIAYEMMGETMVKEHLKYEIEKYLREGLREDYRQDLKVF